MFRLDKLVLAITGLGGGDLPGDVESGRMSAHCALHLASNPAGSSRLKSRKPVDREGPAESGSYRAAGFTLVGLFSIFGQVNGALFKRLAAVENRRSLLSSTAIALLSKLELGNALVL